MMMLFVLKERLKSFYGRHAVLSSCLVKFFYGLGAITLLNHNLGFRTELTNLFVVLAMSAVCMLLPYSAISLFLAMLFLAHIYVVSAEIALVTVVFLVIIALLYYGFQPRDSYWLVLVPATLLLKIPFAAVLIAGLSGTLVTVIPVLGGVLIYYILIYVKQNAGFLTNDASQDVAQKFMQIIKALAGNREMLAIMAICALGILIVSLIRTLSVDYAWIMAILLGTVLQLVSMFVMDYLFGVSVPIAELVVGALLSVAIAGCYHFFVFAVDYTRTEYTQFEDDDYVYYVKAVPKVAVSKPDVKVQRINNPDRERRSRRHGS